MPSLFLSSLPYSAFGALTAPGVLLELDGALDGELELGELELGELELGPELLESGSAVAAPAEPAKAAPNAEMAAMAMKFCVLLRMSSSWDFDEYLAEGLGNLLTSPPDDSNEALCRQMATDQPHSPRISLIEFDAPVRNEFT